jgi:hypothetical protein
MIPSFLRQSVGGGGGLNNSHDYLSAQNGSAVGTTKVSQNSTLNFVVQKECDIKFDEIVLESNEVTLDQLPDYKERKYDNSIYIG